MRKIILLPLIGFLFISLSSYAQKQVEPVSFDLFDVIGADRGVNDVFDCPANAIFSQSPADGPGFIGYISDSETASYNQKIFDNFYSTFGNIEGITFWGLMLDRVTEVDCHTFDPMDFEITFYQNNAGLVGDAYHSFNITVTPTDAGVIGVSTILRFDVTFPSSFQMGAGFVSVVKQNPENSECLFGWLSTGNGDDFLRHNKFDGPFFYFEGDASFCLTGSPTPVPVSNWAVIIGLLLIGTFVVIRFRKVF